MSEDVDLSPLRFREAFPIWLRSRRRFLRERTFKNVEGYGEALGLFFGSLRICDIHAGHLREYQLARECNHKGQWTRPAGPSAVNHEMSCLAQVMERAGCWKKLKAHYQPLPLPRHTPKRVMDYEEEQRFRDYVPQTDEEILAYLVAVITNNTSVSGCELRGLCHKDVLIYGDHAELRVPDDSVKNEYRARRVPLNRTARNAVEQCVIRANRLGSFAPDHYLFPIRVCRGKWDAGRPASRSWLRKSWVHLRRETGMAWIRPHDLRHQFITRALEKGVDEKHLIEITGHISPKILKEYSHIRMECKRTVVDLLDSHAPKRTTKVRRKG